MKLYLFLILIPVLSFSQSDSTFLHYYPLNNGDIWEYRETIFDPPVNPTSYFRKTVVGDTVLPNGKNYKIIRKEYISPPQNSEYLFERIDTVSSRVYRYNTGSINSEYLLDSLRMQIGDTIRGSRGIYPFVHRFLCSDIQEQSFLGITTWTKVLRDLDVYGVQYYELSKKIGFKYYLQYSMGGFSQTIIYAKINGVEYGTPLGIDDFSRSALSDRVRLLQNYPNPFNPITIIGFDLPEDSNIKLEIYDITGRRIRILAEGRYPAGSHRVVWDGRDDAGNAAASGVYVYRLSTGSKLQTPIVASHKMVLMK